MRILVINGPNLNLLGTRDPDTYGTETLDDLERTWRRHAARMGISINTFQTNHEGAIIDAIQNASGRFDGIVLNAGALSHYSYAIYDALTAVGIPTVEIHISNIYERDPWRQTSVTGRAAVDIIYGRGTIGYINAIDLIASHVGGKPSIFEYGDGVDNVLDLRIPGEGTLVPLAILVHGGFWRDVWKRDIMAPLGVALTHRGWATANIEYSRGPGSFPAALNDVADAIEWVRDNGAQHGIDTETIVLVGHSAGGYLALKLAHTDDRLAGVVALAPVTDLEAVATTRTIDDPVSAFLDVPAGADPEKRKEASIDGQPLCTIRLIHGRDDEDVSASQTMSYVADHPDMASAQLLDGTGHMELIDPCDPAFGALTAALDEISDP
ncbi:MAG: hypothetical protein BMS9Abin20_0966 [Acidimicrobiia bacterium]|nr:MAG: hypothetical protein BMS9Abin20_0966 [Acidimicrobiia bacterium]